MATFHAKGMGVFEVDLDTVPLDQLYKIRHMVETAIMIKDGGNTPSLAERAAKANNDVAMVVKLMRDRLKLQTLLDARVFYEHWLADGKFEPIQEERAPWTYADIKKLENSPTREELVMYYEQNFVDIIFSLKQRFQLTTVDARNLFGRWKAEGLFDR